MPVRNIFKILAACLAVSAFSSVHADVCNGDLIVVRHAEDNQPKKGAKHLLRHEGDMHAEAYSHLLRQSSSKWISSIPPFKDATGVKENICPITTILSSHCSGNCEGGDLGYSTNPYQTVIKLRDALRTEGININIQTKDKNNVDFTDNYPWSNQSFLSLLKAEPDHQSTLLSFSKEALWASDDPFKANRNGLLIKLLNPHAKDYESNKQRIDNAGSPHFNWIYVFEDQQSDHTFNKVKVYIQLYGINGDKNPQCIGDLHTDYSQIQILKLYQIPDNGNIDTGLKCTW